MNGRAPPSRDSRSLLWLSALGYTAFVIYGSLVPLKFHALPWEVALARFGAIPFLQLGIGSRADWVANLLLFIPLTYLWMGAMTGGRGRLRNLFATLALVPAATALSVGIEFTQLFFPQRTVSQNDIFAETLGGLIGVLAWWLTGARFVDWLQAWRHDHARAALAERLAWTYLAGVVVYNVLPLDLTISLVEIFHKWRDGMVVLIPFGDLPHDPAMAVYEIATDALIWTPLALLWRLDGTRSAWRAWGMTLAAATGLEFAQLFVFSRVSDVTDILTAGLGGALGSVVGGRLARRDAHHGTPLPWGTWLPFALAAGWMVVLLFVFWFPFDFRTDGAFVKDRLDFVQRVPFEVYYFGTEYRAITEVLRKTLFFAPLGGWLAWGVARQPWRWRGPLFAVAMLILVLMPALIELGQVMLPEKIADTTDWFLAWMGGLAGYAVTHRFLRAPRHAAAPRASHRAAPESAAESLPAPRAIRARWHLPLVLGGMGALFWGAGHFPSMPYNVRELLRPENAWLSALWLALTCYWLAVGPVWLARRQVSGLARLGQVPLGLLAYGAIAFLLLDAAVPDESLFDLGGSPVLGWPGQWELGLRWTALALIPGALIYLATQTVRRWRGRRLGALHFLAALPALGLAYWGVVVQADTDNLVELMATPQPLAFAALCAWLYLLFLAAALLASPATVAQRALRWVGVLVSWPLAALFLHLGLAGSLDKYGQQFSALQFLLSTDRQHYAAMPVIWLRYSVLHGLVIAALAFIQWPHFRAGQRQQNHHRHEPH
ncbi:MAG: VanZ family protein [Thiobacillus sp. 63-78]|uniref:VanZ family protein n=1 Tax=Thiobacillus sp. 63-78 TaxID=1895859 RepID=UPI00095B15E4|nr:VanZ family protein [Thiobacillus sp. 63-78]MBN8764160.1 VanZ family protein [Thiobacillus sp.]MBN8773779.1 VanZ family protein [Thiobacillus sp.]OJZ15953.1 MAG: VanZ family protein [Thiobacillus sp. 63-78]